MLQKCPMSKRRNNKTQCLFRLKKRYSGNRRTIVIAEVIITEINYNVETRWNNMKSINFKMKFIISN